MARPIRFRPLLLAALFASPVLFPAPAMVASPRLWIWAWDRPEDLRFLHPQEAGVAFYILGLRLGSRGLEVRPRTAPLRLPAGAHRIAVVRMEMDPETASEARVQEVAAAIRKWAMVPGLEALQLDFDARRSQRPFYRRLLKELSRGPIPLSITALASWCMGDPWIRELPVQESVAMLFRLGDRPQTTAWMRSGRPLASPAALAWGLSTDEPLGFAPPPGARVYCFHPRPWTPAAFRRTLRMMNP